jgi:DNA-binding NarL/FixJ family response regulator
MKKKKILIIDDFQPLLEEIVEFLSFEGYQTYSAKDGVEGVQLAIQHLPDLIICDIEMPKMNGYDVFKNLEKMPSTASVPFIFLTAKAQVEDFKTGLKLGVDDYITKPLDLDDLLASISKRLSKHEKLLEIHESKLDILIKNPIIGTFIYVEDTFLMTNEKFENMTSYSKSELNHLRLSQIILGETDQVISKLKSCLTNIHDSLQLKVSFINKYKKACFAELFIKHIEIESKNAIIGTAVELYQSSNKSPNAQSGIDQSLKEFNKVIDYLYSIGKDEIADEVINVKELIDFGEESTIQKVKKKIQLSKRETEILDLICNGNTNVEIAEKLFISHRTVDNHRANLLSKIGAKNTAALLMFAFKNNLVNF